MRTDSRSTLKGRRLLVAVSGSIAAVKTPLLVSALVKAGAQVRCLVTPSAEHLVSPVALASLSRHRCYRDQDQWDPSFSRPLLELAGGLSLLCWLTQRNESCSLGPGLRWSARRCPARL